MNILTSQANSSGIGHIMAISIEASEVPILDTLVKSCKGNCKMTLRGDLAVLLLSDLDDVEMVRKSLS